MHKVQRHAAAERLDGVLAEPVVETGIEIEHAVAEFGIGVADLHAAIVVSEGGGCLENAGHQKQAR